MVLAKKSQVDSGQDGDYLGFDTQNSSAPRDYQTA